MSRLREQYQENIVPALMERFSYSSVMEVPKVEKVVVSMGVGEATQDPKALDGAVTDLQIITGQKPVITRAKKSVSTFKLRKGMPIGAYVTLRGDRMWDFLERLLGVALPRVRDFRGVPSRSFDGRGNYSIGIKDQLIFPEIDYDKVDKLRGMNVTIVTTAKTDEEARALLKELGTPFRD